MVDILLLLGGLVCLVVGGELLVRGSVAVAAGLRVPPLVIGLTLVGFGTSTPELVTSLQAAFAGSPGIAMGNVVGSNIGNILLILGLTAAFRSIAVNPASLRRDGGALALATLACVAVVLMGAVGRLAGLGLVALLAAYLAYTLITERRRETAAGEMYAAEAGLKTPAQGRLWLSALTAVAGLAITILGARLLVTGAVSLAAAAGISETVIGLTVVAIGTSLPELVTSIIAIRKGESDVAFGNIVGSNIFNILGILGITALVHPLAVPPEIARLDIWVMSAATVALIVFAWTGWRVGRREGAAFLAAYGVYLGVLLTG
jgi:cation:H+ antiporter